MKTVLVTGGAKGIGLILSNALLRDGWRVHACGRSKSSTSEFIAYTRVDLLLAGAAKSLLRNMPLPDALICNAGDYGALGRFAEIDFTKWRDSFNLNFFAVAELVHEYLRLSALEPNLMGMRRKVVIVGGAGIGGPKTVPGISAYSCAKAALVDFVELVRLEVPLVDINVLAPGAIKTGITVRAEAAGIETPEPSAPNANLERRAGQAIVRLLDPELDGVSGRLISARWDDLWLAAPETIRAGSSALRLRRIDGDLFKTEVSDA